jgi:hypothetical protein
MMGGENALRCPMHGDRALLGHDHGREHRHSEFKHFFKQMRHTSGF